MNKTVKNQLILCCIGIVICLIQVFIPLSNYGVKSLVYKLFKLGILLLLILLILFLYKKVICKEYNFMFKTKTGKILLLLFGIFSLICLFDRFYFDGRFHINLWNVEEYLIEVLSIYLFFLGVYLLLESPETNLGETCNSYSDKKVNTSKIMCIIMVSITLALTYFIIHVCYNNIYSYIYYILVINDPNSDCPNFYKTTLFR